MLTPKELVLTFRSCYLGATFGGENQSRKECGQTGSQSDTRCDRDKLNLYFIAMGHIITLTTYYYYPSYV